MLDQNSKDDLELFKIKSKSITRIKKVIDLSVMNY